MNRYRYLEPLPEELPGSGIHRGQIWDAKDPKTHAPWIRPLRYCKEVRAGDWACDIANMNDSGHNPGYVSTEHILYHFKLRP